MSQSTSPVYNKLAILGVGLMGASLAASLKREAAVSEVVGWGRNPDNLILAQNNGIIDSWSLDLDKVLVDVDCVVVATPTQFSEQLLVDVIRQCSSDVVISDVASVKGNLVRALNNQFGEVPSNVVLGHPIAGSEKSGVTACNPDLYKNHNVILVDTEKCEPAKLASVEQMWLAAGANVSMMSAEQHDRVLALTSHLPHLLSYALVEQIVQSDYEADVFEYAAGGFKDFTRIAGSDPVMWAEICLANNDQILPSVQDYIDQLQKIKAAIESNDRDSLLEIFASAKQHRDAFSDAYSKRINEKD